MENKTVKTEAKTETKAKEKAIKTEEPIQVQVKELNMNDKSKVKNLCAWQISWERDSSGDETIKPNATIYIVNSEIESQVLNGNKFFCGTDTIGSHAKVYIENPELREYLKFDSKEEKRSQLIIDDEECRKLFEYKTLDTFKKNVEKSIVTNSEKSKIMNYARKIKIDSYEKIQVLEEHCDLKFRIDDNVI